MIWLHDVSQVNDVSLGQLPDRRLRHLNRILELIFSQLNLKLIVLLLASLTLHILSLRLLQELPFSFQ